MSKVKFKSLIENCQNGKCTTAEMENMLEIFASTLESIAATKVRKAWFELEEFSESMGEKGFSLTIERVKVKGEEQWWGVFENGKKHLKITATTEEN